VFRIAFGFLLDDLCLSSLFVALSSSFLFFKLYLSFFKVISFLFLTLFKGSKDIILGT
jgi:hypothetical protein